MTLTLEVTTIVGHTHCIIYVIMTNKLYHTCLGTLSEGALQERSVNRVVS